MVKLRRYEQRKGRKARWKSESREAKGREGTRRDLQQAMCLPSDFIQVR
jgi:hypothetical protein